MVAFPPALAPPSQCKRQGHQVKVSQPCRRFVSHTAPLIELCVNCRSNDFRGSTDDREPRTDTCDSLHTFVPHHCASMAPIHFETYKRPPSTWFFGNSRHHHRETGHNPQEEGCKPCQSKTRTPTRNATKLVQVYVLAAVHLFYGEMKSERRMKLFQRRRTTGIRHV